MCNFHQIYNDFLASGATLPSDPEAYRQSNWQKKHFFCTADSHFDSDSRPLLKIQTYF